jgi:hypothetical protein
VLFTRPDLQVWVVSNQQFNSLLLMHNFYDFFQVHNSFYHVTDPFSSGGKFLAQTRMAGFNSTNASHKLTHETGLFNSLQQ